MFRTACQTADQGLAFACAALPAPVSLQAYGARSSVPAVVGWTTPTITYNRMRSLQGEALQLDTKVDRFVAKMDPFYAAWKAWYQNTWTPFYQRYAGPDSSDWAKGIAAFESDAIAEQQRTYENEYDSLRTDYNSHPGVPQQGAARQPPDDSFGSSLPWWFWVGGTVVVAGVAYVLYRNYTKGRATSQYVRKHPEVLAAIGGPEAVEAVKLHNAVHD